MGLMPRDWSSLLSRLCEGTMRRQPVPVYKPERGPSGSNGMDSSLTLDFPASTTARNKFLLVKAHSACYCYFFLWFELISTVLKTIKI